MSQIIYTPSISKIDEMSDKKATLTIEPLLPGYGMTLGNSLRRVLLSSISGAAIVAFRAQGATHEFTTLPGVKEDLTQIMLNLKGVRFRVTEAPNQKDTALEEDLSWQETPMTLTIEKKGEGLVLAKDIQPNPYLEVVNGDHLIASLDGVDSQISLELVVAFGLGYLSIEDSEASYAQNDFISIDALFSPVLRVRFKLENTRVGQMTNLDKLNLTIETDGSITPKAAFEQAAAILKEHYTTLSGEAMVNSQAFAEAIEENAAEAQTLETDSRLELYLEDLQLSARTTNALTNNDLHIVKDIINLSDAELKELKGFGAIALQELKEKMRELGF